MNAFIYTLKNRFNKIQLILNSKKNIYFLGNFLFDKELIPQDTKHFHTLHCSNDWNNYIYFKTFQYLSKKKILKKKYFINKKNIQYNYRQKKKSH